MKNLIMQVNSIYKYFFMLKLMNYLGKPNDYGEFSLPRFIIIKSFVNKYCFKFFRYFKMDTNGDKKEIQFLE